MKLSETSSTDSAASTTSGPGSAQLAGGDPESKEPQGQHPRSNKTSNGNDAVCFTAGFAGAIFGAGTIHAYLVSDRKPPQIVAGISMGALNAAAMQRCYQELQAAQGSNPVSRDIARWRWYRRYLTMLSDHPLRAIWRGLPQLSDFSADLPPVKDTSVEQMSGHSVTRDYWVALEKLARRELYLFKKLGNWLARLPLKVSTIADFLVTYVRVKEQVPGWKRFWRFKFRVSNPARLFWPILWHVCWSPEWFFESQFQTRKYSQLKYFHPSYWIRPLFGWPVFLLAWSVLLLLGTSLVLLIRMVWGNGLHQSILYAVLFLLFIAPAGAFVFAMVMDLVGALKRVFRRKGSPEGAGFMRWFVAKLGATVFRSLEMQRALVNNFHLRLALARLFEEKDKPLRLCMTPMPLVVVAAPLQTLQLGPVRRGIPQVWARKGARLVDTLVAAVAVPGLFEPLHLERPEPAARNKKDPYDLDHWEVGSNVTALDLVDGSMVRENPLPALFQFIKRPGRRSIANAISSSPDDPRVHVVFTVPLGEQKGGLKTGPLGADIVDVLITSLRLNRRRDTKLEVLQTNFMSELEYELRSLGGKPSGKLHPIFADSISPEKDLHFKDPLRPTPVEVLEATAAGCRRTLQTLYATELRAIPGDSASIDCHQFLTQIAPERNWSLHPKHSPGLPEICSHCSRVLGKERRPVRRKVDPELPQKYPQLTGAAPRIVFLASGGVFRGSFHAGMLACLLATDIRPDIIVGASVGTLLGGVLGALLTASDSSGQLSYERSLRLLGHLADVLLCVDRRIAFTKSLKSAARELGIRARQLRLSPNQIRKLVKRGGRSDAGFAAIGAPPALVDALSNLLLVPNRRTSIIAAEFVAGHVTKATKDLLLQMKSETLRRLDIEYALMGVSLLEPTARQLLGDESGVPLNQLQPFQRRHIAFFGTTTNLMTETPYLLGLYDVGGTQSYDFVQAALASSAFPAIFSPRREADIFPGVGRPDIFFSDGGMFDNLPFIFTLELLASTQRLHRMQTGIDSIAFLKQRHANPDLFIAGSLNVPPEKEQQGESKFDTLPAIARRASSLQYNVKIRAFQDSAEMISDEVECLLKAVSPQIQLTERSQALIDGIVEASVLPVFPVDRDHLNPTYAFCASTGLERARVERSIANGCFQTFAALADAQSPQPSPDSTQAARSMKPLVEAGRIPHIRWTTPSGGKAVTQGSCPYFRHSTQLETRQLGGGSPNHNAGPIQEFICPFYQADTDHTKAIYAVCCTDQAHQKEFGLQRIPRDASSSGTV
jgi:predicted acylesterase/phospholipase RssA